MAVQEFDAALVPAERRSRTAERWMWGIVGTLLIVTFIDLALRGPLLEIPLYVGGNMLLLPFLGIGLFYRLVRPDERIASTALCFVALAMFTHVGASVNHAFLPLWRPTIDGTLAAWDAAIGMHWPSAMALAAEYPLLSRIGGLIYASSIPQIMLTLFVLGLSGLRAQLERFVLAAMLGACAAIAFWIVFPSFGPSTLYDLPDEVVRAVDPIVGPRYGAELLQLGREGDEPFRLLPHGARPARAAGAVACALAALAGARGEPRHAARRHRAWRALRGRSDRRRGPARRRLGLRVPAGPVGHGAPRASADAGRQGVKRYSIASILLIDSIPSSPPR